MLRFFSHRSGSLQTPMGTAALGAAVVLAALATSTTADPDLWGHLLFGLDMIEARSLTAVDPYSFTQDRPWVNHEWLSELQLGLAYSAGGVAGLALLKGLLVVAALGLAWAALRDVRTDARMIAFAALATGTIGVTRTLRPQLWTLVALAILCRVLLAADRRHRRWFPVLFALWANAHGGWIVGFGVLCVWTAMEAVAARRISVEGALIVVASLIATLVNPYGWGLWHFLVTTVSLSGRAITEWQPLWNSPMAASVLWVATVAATVWLAREKIPHRLQILGVLALLAYASLKVLRIGPLYLLCGTILLAGALARRWPAGPPKPAARGEWPVAVFICAVCIAISGWVLSTSLRCIAIDDGDRAADADAVRLLKSAEPGKLVTFFDWGEYAIWHLGPRLKVSMDGRRETVYTDKRLDEHGAILHGSPQGFEVLDSWQPEYVWLPATSTATRDWLVSRGYRLEHESPRSFVAVRSDLPRLVRRPATEDAFSCFPG